MDALIQSLVQANFAPERIAPQAPMAQYTTLRIGGPAEVMVNIHSADEIAVALRAAKQADAPVTIIGNGSNLLVRDGGIRGLVPECHPPRGRLSARAGGRVAGRRRRLRAGRGAFRHG